MTARAPLRFESGYRLSFRFNVIEFTCDYAVLAGLFTTFGHNAGGGITSGPTLCDSGKALAGRDCRSPLAFAPGWHNATVDARPPAQGVGRSVTLTVDGRTIPGQDVDDMASRTTLDLLVGPHYMPSPADPGSCATIRVRYDDILVEVR